MVTGRNAGLEVLSMQDFRHTTVLLDEAVTALKILPTGIYIDGTFGRGGHSRKILESLNPNGQLWGIDKDPRAISTAHKLKESYPNLQVYRGSFSDLTELAEKHNLAGKVNGVLLDLGVSSPQLDDANRGFSFMKDGPLDMRMDPESGISAAEWLNTASLDDITHVLKVYGEEKFGKRIATAIVKERQSTEIKTTAQLVEIIQQATPVKDKFKHPATRSFQGIRIFINHELDDLKNCLDSVLDLLTVGGRLVVISFHSLEDRMIKRFMRDQSRGEQFPPGMAVTEDMLNRRLKIIGKAIKPSAAEIEINKRSRSAVMRIAEKIA